MTVMRHRLRERFPSLAAYGVAAQHFPAFHGRGHVRNAHDVSYASLLLSGRARHVVAGIVLEDLPGTLTVVAPEQEHQIHSDRSVEVINLYLDFERHPPPTLPIACVQALHRLFPSPTPRPARALVQVALPQPVTTARLLHALIERQDGSGPGHASRLHALASAILIDCAEGVIASGVRLPLLESEPVRRVAELIDRSYADPLTLADCAAVAGWSPAHLCRRYKEQTGTTIVQALQRRRIDAATLALRQDDDRIIDIAFSCGFRDLAHFNRCFKAQVGCTPRQWRRRGPDGVHPGAP